MCLGKGLIKPEVGRLRHWNGHFGIQTAIILDTEEEMFLKKRQNVGTLYANRKNTESFLTAFILN